jgi:protein-tyrosine-phosphatase
MGFGLVAAQAAAQEVPAEYKQVREGLGKQGDFKDGVLKVNIPRRDLPVRIAKRPAPTPFGFGGWVALTKGTDGSDVLMGDLVLTEDEVNPVMSALLDNGLEVTALHNHFFWEQPRIFYMHVHGVGRAVDLAARLKPAIGLIDKASPASATSGQGAAASSLDTAKLAAIIGHDGEQNGPVYKITVGRPDIEVREHGAVINARMGLNTWAAFAGSNDDAMVAGDVAMLENEVTPVLKALRGHALDVVALHHHMIGSSPMVVFLHYFGTGPAADLAQGVRAALDVLGKAGGASHRRDARDERPVRKVLFICPHGAAKSVLASAYFQRRAKERGLNVAVDFAGTDPDPAIAPRVMKRLDEQGIAIPKGPPRRVTASALDEADLIITLGCDLEGFASHAGAKRRRWDEVPLPRENFELADQAIVKRVNELVEELVGLRDAAK